MLVPPFPLSSFVHRIAFRLYGSDLAIPSSNVNTFLMSIENQPRLSLLLLDNFATYLNRNLLSDKKGMLLEIRGFWGGDYWSSNEAGDVERWQVMAMPIKRLIGRVDEWWGESLSTLGEIKELASDCIFVTDIFRSQVSQFGVNLSKLALTCQKCTQWL